MNKRFLGALGFGVGGLIVGLSGDFFVFAIYFIGLIGHAVLSIPAKNIPFAISTTLLGITGFLLGLITPMFISLSIFDLNLTIVGMFMGVVVGMVLGKIFKDIVSFSFFGLVGFGLCGLIISIFRQHYENISPEFLTLFASVVAGILLGHAAILSRKVEK